MKIHLPGRFPLAVVNRLCYNGKRILIRHQEGLGKHRSHSFHGNLLVMIQVALQYIHIPKGVRGEHLFAIHLNGGKMKKKMLMLLLAATLMTTTVMQTEMKVHALTQDEMIAIWRERGSARQTTGGSSIPAAGYEFNGSFDGLVSSAQQEIKNATIQRAAERGLTVREYLEQTGQSHAIKFFDEATLGSSGAPTTTQPQTPAEPKEEHKHNYSQSVTKESTCTEEGETTFTCECGDTYEEEIPVVDHEKGAMETTREATCTEAGERTAYCKYCGEVLGTESVEPYGHTEGELTTEKEPTMFEKGLKTIRCTECNEILHSEEIPVEMMNWYIIGGVAVAALVIIGVAVLKRKR